MNKNRKPLLTRIGQSVKQRLRAYYGPKLDTFTINRFHKLWYNNKYTWRKNTYLGHSIILYPPYAMKANSSASVVGVDISDKKLTLKILRLFCH